VPSTKSPLSLIVTGGAGFIGSNLTLTLQEKLPEARLTVIDDFRSGNFKNLTGYRGDFVAQNLATLNWGEKFGDEKFDAIFHLASITDTTLHDQFVQVHDNVESFRRLLNFARLNKTRIIYASSASTYGAVTQASVESNGAAPANAYSFSKAIMDNIARRAAAESPGWVIVGLRYFNVYGPHEAHKGVPASMVYHLAQQMKTGHRPRIFKHGEQKRDFVYVKDAVEGMVLAMERLDDFEPINLAAGNPCTVRDVLGMLLAIDGHKDAEIRYDLSKPTMIPKRLIDPSKADRLLGFKARTSMEDGLARTVRWYRSTLQHSKSRMS